MSVVLNLFKLELRVRCDECVFHNRNVPLWKTEIKMSLSSETHHLNRCPPYNLAIPVVLAELTSDVPHTMNTEEHLFHCFRVFMNLTRDFHLEHFILCVPFNIKLLTHMNPH